MDTKSRLERLEKDMRFYKRLTVVLALMIVAGVSMGQTDNYGDIVCRSLKVVNEKGEPTAIITEINGDGFLATISSSGKELVRLTALDGNGALITSSSSGNLLVGLGAHKDVGGLISVFNKTGEEVCTMYPDEYGNGVIGAWNRKGKGRKFESK